MIKYFHELTEAEYIEVVVDKLTYGECDELYPQPYWCSYPDATHGLMGCWSLIYFMVAGRDYCRKCDDCYIKGARKPKSITEVTK